tara:strand:- start:1823 stop:1936 length:114 start_codon:yes stop_codon:yes gene_type:complete
MEEFTATDALIGVVEEKNVRFSHVIDELGRFQGDGTE